MSKSFLYLIVSKNNEIKRLYDTHSNSLLSSLIKMKPSKEYEKREKACNDQIDKFNKLQAPTVGPIIAELNKYVPEFTSLIVTRTLIKMINIISMGNIPRDVLDDLIDLILNMINKSNGNPDEDPFKTLFLSKEFLIGIFLRTGLDESGQFNHKVITLIYQHLIAKGPQFFVDFLSESKESVYALMNALADKGKYDYEAELLFNQLFVCNPKVKQSLIPEIIPLIRKFSPHLVVDLMIASNEIKNTMTMDEFEEWLLEQENYTLSDVNQVFTFYKELWPRILSMKMILRTDPPKKQAFIKWIHGMPAQDIELPEELTRITLDQMMNPKYEFETVEDEHLKNQKFNTRDFYLFSRLFVLTHAHPDHVINDKESTKFLFNLIHEQSEYVAAAALQVLIIWIAKYDFAANASIVYQIAEEIESNRSEAIKCLYQLCLHYLATKHKVAEMMLRAEKVLRFIPRKKALLTRSSWEFMNFEPFIDQAPMFELYDEKVMLQILDCITEYLGIQEEEEDQLE
ncbi:hypothetical protein TRFO_22093 [Tritrichomonas foetus]|uniref:Uncharacterized protein n=1 Tax=Tritrichomonas foetus TaxID=1144522 RepID=A0A1J4KCL4_9EUKA|nr:hypothetical protein TRFO_22093 [Tritrichomonas foetus]|eukprot:OHT09167.1 hypothetical protein TRFO_22093 [Tritrichomonas foetus]